MAINIGRFFFASAVVCGSVTLPQMAASQPIYSISGKSYEVNDLSPALQQQMYDIQFEAFEKTKHAVDNAVFDTYVAEEAKKSGKSVDEATTKILDVKEPSDKDLKSWYEENKSKIPAQYKYDDIKGEITKIVKQERMKAKRDQVLDKIKKDQKFAMTMSEPDAPVVSVLVDGFPSKGSDQPKLTIIEFADYQCPHCKGATETIKKVVDKFKNKAKLVFIDFPINPSGIARAVAEGSHCAAEQGRFWEFHYKAFEIQSTLDQGSADKIAKDLKLDEAKFKNCKDGGRGKVIVDKGRAEGDRIGVSGTPYILMNGKRYAGPHTVEAITKKVESLLK
jgi:protein-disulfide isomerase